MNRPIIIVIIIIILLYTPYLKYKYNKFYNEVPQEIKLEAIIISNAKEENYYNSYIIKGKNNIFKNKKFILYTKEKLEFGDKINVTGFFLEPAEQRNYKGFNYKKYLQTQAIYGSIKVKEISIISKNNLNNLLTLSNQVRNKIIENTKKILPEDTRGLLIGILLGDKTYLEDDMTNSFQKSSLAHILAVSGVHVSYLILGVTFFISINKLSKKCGYFLTIFILIVFLFLTNFSVSVIRASIMAIILIVSKLVYRKADIINTILISIFFTIINNPFSIYSVSFQLSYLGTIGVIYFLPILNEQIQKIIKNQKFSRILSVPISAQIFILPIIITNFHTISFTFLISNVLSLPLLGVTIILGFITIFISFLWIGLAQKLGIVLNLILKIIIQIAKLCSNLKLSNIYVITPSLVTIFIYYFCALLLLYLFNLNKILYLKKYEKYMRKIFSKNQIKRIFFLLLIVVVLVEIPYINFNGKLKIFFIDVGQRR